MVELGVQSLFPRLQDDIIRHVPPSYPTGVRTSVTYIPSIMAPGRYKKAASTSHNRVSLDIPIIHVDE